MITVNITTFPRSGRNFLWWHLANLNLKVEAYHDTKFILDKNKNYIGIIRNPYDSISSIYAMETFFEFEKIYKEKIKYKSNEQIIIDETKKSLLLKFDKKIEDLTNYYINYYNFYFNNFDNILLLKFEDIVENIDLSLLKITEKFKIPFNKTNNFMLPKVNDTNHLNSSKDTEWYEYAVKNIKNNDQMKKANEIYNILLNKINAL